MYMFTLNITVYEYNKDAFNNLKYIFLHFDNFERNYTYYGHRQVFS